MMKASDSAEPFGSEPFGSELRAELLRAELLVAGHQALQKSIITPCIFVKLRPLVGELHFAIPLDGFLRIHQISLSRKWLCG